MRITIDAFETGWVGMALAIRADEIQSLIERLNALQSGEIGHFHCRAIDFTAEKGVADLEVSLMGEQELDNLTIE